MNADNPARFGGMSVHVVVSVGGRPVAAFLRRSQPSGAWVSTRASSSESSPAERNEMSFTAHLPGMQLPDVLQVISTSKQSGVATVIHSGASAKLVFVDGRVVYASSDTKSRLGFSLVKRGFISEEDLARALRHQKKRQDGVPLASVLVKLGIVEIEVLEHETRQHITSVFGDLMRWPEGMIFFEVSETPRATTVLREGLSVESLLLEAAVANDSEPQFDREICEFWPKPVGASKTDAAATRRT